MRRVRVVLDPEYRPWQPDAPAPVRLRRPPRKWWQKAIIFLLPFVALGVVIVIAGGGRGMGGGRSAGAQPAHQSSTAAARPTSTPTPTPPTPPPLLPGPGYRLAECGGVWYVFPLEMNFQCP